MKTITLQGIKTCFIALICGLTLPALYVSGGEFVIINQTFTYTSGANAFSCHASPPYPGNVPTNWLTPDDYWDGTFHAYYEVIDIPTDQPFGMQMGIFQYYPSAADWDGHNYRETCSLSIPTFQGEGDYAEINYGSPANWWQHPTGAVDFSRVYDYESVGPVMYSRTPGAYGILYTKDTAAWEVRSNYFPCTLRVIVVAVSSGSAFSGWSNYLGGCTPVQQATPTYEIDYSNERTNKGVPTTDEYSYSSNMSGAVSGTGAYLNLTPGQDVYFRTKQNGACYLASAVQHLDVPSRPATPSFTVDYLYETTAQTVNSAIEYSTSASFTDASTGAENAIPVTPGQDLYFRTKATASAFVSQTFLLDVPARPSTPTVTIDYSAEKTNESFPATIAYSTSSSYTDPVNCTGIQIALIPGQDLYIWVKATASAFASMDYHLVVPGRLAAPAFTVDYRIEKTAENINSAVEYSASPSFESPSTGDGNAISLTPGQDIYFRTKATTIAFASQAFLLDVPERPAMPSATIDYSTEKTIESFPVTIEYSTSSSYTDPVNCTGTQITLIPGQDLYIWLKVTASSFASMDLHLVVPARPASPSYTIDFSNERTNENVPAGHEYATAEDMTGAISGAGSPLDLIPGIPVYFRTKSTNEVFASLPLLLTVPVKPEIITEVGDTMEGDFFEASLDFHAASDGYDLSDIETTNASLEDLGSLTVKVTPDSYGPLSIKIAANALDAGNFASKTLTTYYKNPVSLADVHGESGYIKVFPTPVRDMLNVDITDKLIKPVQILFFDNDGTLVLQKRSSSIQTDIDMKEYPEGLYILEIIDSRGNVISCKVIKQ